MSAVLDLPRNIGSLPTAIVLCPLLLLLSAPLVYLAIGGPAVSAVPNVWIRDVIGRGPGLYIAALPSVTFSLVATSLVLWARKGWMRTFVAGMMAVIITASFMVVLAVLGAAATADAADAFQIVVLFGLLIALFFYHWWWVPVGGVITLLAVTLVSLLFGAPKTKMI